MGFKVSQEQEEIEALLKEVGEISSYLEIGSYAGESLLYVYKYLKEGSTVVLVDLPVNQKARDHLMKVIETLGKAGITVHLISGDSQDPFIIEKAREFAPSGFYDLTFIDGNHDFDYVVKDLHAYGPMSKRIAMHDIDPRAIKANKAKHGYEKPSAAHVWQVLKMSGETQEFIKQGSSKPRGLGLLRGTSISA